MTDCRPILELINPHSICREFSKLILLDHPEDDRRETTNIEKSIAEKLWKSFSEIMSDYTIEEDEELIVGESQPSQEEWLDDDGTEMDTSESYVDNCNIETKMKILAMIEENPNWKLKTIQKNGGAAFKHRRYKKRWEQQIAHGGTKFEKYTEIDRCVFEKFEEHRKKFKFIRGSHIRRWALQRALEFRDSDFKFTASLSWATRFKSKHGITSRKVTHLVSRREIRDPAAILESAQRFQEEVKQLSLDFEPAFVLNTDQCGFNYELLSNRTLSWRGEKTTMGFAESPTNNVTHSYTAQYTINKDGHIFGDVFLCLREPKGKLSPGIENSLFPAANVTLTCSKSGKLSTSLVEYYLDKILVGKLDKKFLFIIDSWPGQIDPNLYTDRFREGTEAECTLRIIPEKCTPFCQPLDTTFHRQIKYFAREIQCYAALEDETEISSRNNIIRTQSLIRHQIGAPLFRNMIKFSWFSAGLTDERTTFINVKEGCFNLKKLKCEFQSSNNKVCGEKSFIQCSHCRMYLCFSCFYWDYHPPYCQS